MDKLFIQNRKGQKVSVLIETAMPQKGLAFLMHGLGGFKEQPQLETIKDVFNDNGYTVVRFDTTNTFGESEGNYEDATITNYYEDLEDVIAWAKGQDWCQEPFALMGHSLGGICVALYAERYPEQVSLLAPISSVISAKLRLEAAEKYDPERLRIWRETGWREQKSESKPGLLKRLKWSHIVDSEQYDLLPEAHKLTMPTLFIAGSKDESTPYEQQQMLYDAVTGPKEIHSIEEAPHTFTDPVHLAEIRRLFDTWIESFVKYS